MGYRVEVRDKDLRRIGEIDTWLQLNIIVRYRSVGSWKLLVRAGTEQAELLQRGGGVAIYQDGVEKPVISGPIDSFQKYFTTEQHSSMGSLFVGGPCDNHLAFDRLAFPDPSKPIAQQYTSDDNRVVDTKISKAIWYELEHALGTSALTDRRVSGVNIGSEPDFGDMIHDTLRYDNIGEKLESWCETKNAGYRFVYNPNTRSIDLDTFQPRDKSKEIRFSQELGNIREFIWTLDAPKVTRVIVACQGEGKGRYLYQKIDHEAEAEWGGRVIEKFVDRRDLPIVTDPDTGNPVKASLDVTDEEFNNALAAVQQSADEALKEGERKGNFQIYPIDTEQIKFGRDYFVGDIVTVVADGTEYVDVVREVDITVDDGGRSVTVAPKIGEQGSGEPLNLYRTVFEMRRKLSRLEARM